MRFREYISSNGTDFGTNEGDGAFRVNQTQNGWKDPHEKMTVQNLLAEELFQRYSAELTMTCSISKESIAYMIEDGLNTFLVSLQKLVGINIHEVAKYFAFFGMGDQLQFKMNENVSVTPPFMIKAAWIRGSETASVGVGFHPIQLLLLGSLVGPFAMNRVHPKIINDLTRTLIRQILVNAPAAAVPDSIIHVPCFNCFTGVQECIVMGNYPKIDHFLRPRNPTFGLTGKLTECCNVDNFAPEDVLHMGPQCSYAKLIGCKVYEVPPTAVVTYNICKGRYYCIKNVRTGQMGTASYDGDTVDLLLSDEYETSPNSSCSLKKESWNSEFLDMGFIMLPMIWRAGACVLVEQEGYQRVGCIVPPPSDAVDSDEEPILHDGNFCYNAKSYFVSVRYGQTVSLHVNKVMENLLPIGTPLFLKCESESAQPLIRRMATALSTNEKTMNAMKVFLAGPDTRIPIVGKVYVAYSIETDQGLAGEILCVDPWELLFKRGSRGICMPAFV